jgi:hypothetical protein
MSGDLDSFYRRVLEVTQENTSLSPSSRSVVLFRVAIESGAAEIGLPKVMHLMSRLTTVTMGIMAGDSDSSYEDILEDLDPSDMPRH